MKAENEEKLIEEGGKLNKTLDNRLDKIHKTFGAIVFFVWIIMTIMILRSCVELTRV